MKLITLGAVVQVVSVGLFIWAIVLLTGCQGPEGIRGPIGATGSSGQSIVGPQGPAGQNGSNGLDSTPIAVVNLCTEAPSYPGVFVEVALLINNRLYAVYSQNGGFMTYLPPGNYSSNGIGSACNFTVNTDNTISH